MLRDELVNKLAVETKFSRREIESAVALFTNLEMAEAVIRAAAYSCYTGELVGAITGRPEAFQPFLVRL